MATKSGTGSSFGFSFYVSPIRCLSAHNGIPGIVRSFARKSSWGARSRVLGCSTA